MFNGKAKKNMYFMERKRGKKKGEMAAPGLKWIIVLGGKKILLLNFYFPLLCEGNLES